MTLKDQQPQNDEGYTATILKYTLRAALLIGALWATQWAIHKGPDLIANARETAPVLIKILTSPQGQEEIQGVPTDLDQMRNVNWLRSRHGRTFRKIRNLPWVKDGLTEQEAKTAQNLIHLGANDPETLKRVLDLEWTGDSITPPEAKAIRWLMYLASRDIPAARRLSEMPFLNSVTEADALLIAGLHSAWHRGTLAGFMNHPTVADGITDDETILVVAATIIDDGSQLGRVLNPGRVTVETVQTASSMTPNLRISIVRPRNRRADDTSLILEEAVEYVERSMGMPLPTDHVIVLLDDDVVSQGYAGVNYGQAIAYRRKGEDETEWDRAAFREGMVHEVAHYFWRGSEDWIDEGMANATEHQFGMDQALPAALITTKRKGCTVSTLRELSRVDPGHDSTQFQCTYYLGEKLFVELQQTIGRQGFQEGSRRLYQMVLALNEEDRKAGIEEVRRAFGEHSPVIAKHWTGEEPGAGTITHRFNR